jgi:branched-chain amino acid transport system permease protein
MFGSILASGLAVGAIYALIGITYNTMFSASRVMSFTAGQLGMLGGVFGSLFVLRLGMPLIVGLLLTLAVCAVVGMVTELVAVRPVLKSLEQHLYVLSTLALALMVQQSTAILWSTEPQPFPRLFAVGAGGPLDERFWLPLLACGVTIVGLELLYRHTLVGLGNNRGSIVGGFVLGIFQQAATFLVGGIFASVAVFALFIIALLAAPQGLFGAPASRRV